MGGGGGWQSEANRIKGHDYNNIYKLIIHQLTMFVPPENQNYENIGKLFELIRENIDGSKITLFNDLPDKLIVPLSDKDGSYFAKIKKNDNEYSLEISKSKIEASGAIFTIDASKEPFKQYNPELLKLYSEMENDLKKFNEYQKTNSPLIEVNENAGKLLEEIANSE